MSNEYIINKTDATSVADVIREKGNITGELIWPEGWKTAIRAIKDGGVSPQLIVTAPSGSTITAVNGEDTATGVIGAEGTLTLDLPAFGTWTVAAVLDGEEANTSVYIEQEYSVSLSYLTTFTINGGHGETVTAFYNGESIGSVSLDATGTGTIDLNSVGGKTITFTGGLSGYSTAVDVGDTREMTVNVYPNGALYWYGRQFEGVAGGWTGYKLNTQDAGGNPVAPVANNRQDHIYIYAPYDSGKAWRVGMIVLNNKINLSGYTKLTCKATLNSSTGDNVLAIWSSTGNNIHANIVSSLRLNEGKNLIPIDLNGEYVIGFHFNTNTYTTDYGFNLYELVLEV